MGGSTSTVSSFIIENPGEKQVEQHTVQNANGQHKHVFNNENGGGIKIQASIPSSPNLSHSSSHTSAVSCTPGCQPKNENKGKEHRLCKQPGIGIHENPK